jgi:hypothetical protein
MLLRDAGILYAKAVALWRPIIEKQNFVTAYGSRTERNAHTPKSYSVIRQIMSDHRAKFWYSVIA